MINMRRRVIRIQAHNGRASDPAQQIARATSRGVPRRLFGAVVEESAVCPGAGI